MHLQSGRSAVRRGKQLCSESSAAPRRRLELCFKSPFRCAASESDHVSRRVCSQAHSCARDSPERRETRQARRRTALAVAQSSPRQLLPARPRQLDPTRTGSVSAGRQLCDSRARYTSWPKVRIDSSRLNLEVSLRHHRIPIANLNPRLDSEVRDAAGQVGQNLGGARMFGYKRARERTRPV